MPGIEQIVNDTTAEKPFKILEIVDNTSEAEIGYYVSGQEPYVKLYQYQYTDDKNQAHTITFDSLDEGLSKISDPVKRKEFAMNVNLNQDGTENEVMPEVESSSDESFSAGDTDSDSGKTKLEDYDLIYLNGTGLKESSYQKILDIVSPQNSKKKPCIINQTKLQNNVTFKSSFESIINDNDRDGHYVNCNVYFFKNNFLPDDQDNGSLLNVSFDKNFNPAYTEEPDSFSDGNSLMEGFEEILKYIEKENKYRKIKENSTNKDNTENQEENTPLSTKISQARAIEYIINYRLKRNDLPTGKIRVLELQLARSQGEITDSQVLRWLGHGMTVQSCCNHNGECAER